MAHAGRRLADDRGLARHPQVADVIFLGALSLLTLAGVVGRLPMVALWFVVTMLVVPWVWF
jgi:hypothetical protein